jgi:heme A synthase
MVLPTGNWLGTGEALALLAVLALTTVGTLALFGVALVATRRRRSRSYTLLTIAIGLLVARSVVGIGTVLGQVPMVVHHLIEHTTDFAIAVLILSAAYLFTGSRSPA